MWNWNSDTSGTLKDKLAAFLKLKIQLPHDTATFYSCMPVFIVALFEIAKKLGNKLKVH